MGCVAQIESIEKLQHEMTLRSDDEDVATTSRRSNAEISHVPASLRAGQF